MDPAALQNLAECLKTLPWWLAFLLVTSLGIQQILSWNTRRQERAHKDARAERYVSTIDGLTAALKEHEIRDLATAQKLEATVTQVQVDLRKCLSAVDNLRLRSRGVMSAISSIRLIQSYYEIVTISIQRAVEQQFWEHGEGSPTDFTTRKVRTVMATVLSQVRERLQAIRQLSVSIEEFFPVYMEHEVSGENALGKERFVLIDTLWAVILPCFSCDGNAQSRVDEINLLIDNAVTDHLSGLIARYRKEHPDAFSGECGSSRESVDAPSITDLR